MSVSGGIITGMGTTIGPSANGDLQTAFGVSQMGKAWFFSTAPIRMGAKNKPFLNTSPTFTDMNARNTARANANYGLTIPTMTQAEIQAMTGEGWTLHRPNGTSYPRRAQDFEGYYHAAPYAPLYCTAPATIVANTINSNSLNPCAFFVYQKSGQLADKQPDATGGTSTTSAGRSSTQIAACLEASELKADSTIITSLTNPYLGIAVFSGTTFKGFAGCTSKLIASQSTRDNDMFIVRLAAFSALGVGTYTGKACIRYGSAVGGYGYVPLPAISGVCNNNFTVKIGGQDMYDAYQVNVKTDGTPSAAGSAVRLRTTSTTIYVTIKVHNGSGIVHDTASGDVNKWILVTNLNGSVVKRGESSSTPVNRDVTSTPYNYTPAAMHMDVNGDCLISYQITNCWSPTQGQVVAISSGSISLTCRLYYNSTSAPFNRPSSGQLLLDIVYGT